MRNTRPASLSVFPMPWEGCIPLSISATMSSLAFAFPRLLLLLIFCFTPTHSFPFPDDRQSLVAFKNLITSDPHHSMADWSPANPLCNWTGVTCSRHHPNRVASLDLAHMDLRGSISPSIGNLSFLRSLLLPHNAFHGHIPPQLGRLVRLRELQLADNELEGNIPSQLGSCRNLSILRLSNNNLTGSIPQGLRSLTNLQELHVEDNELTEYGSDEAVSTKGDVYSYGILLLEMLTRKRPTSDMFSGELNFHKWVNLAFPHKVKEVIDHKILNNVDGDEFEKTSIYKCLLSLLQVGLHCSKDSPNERPTMRDVVMVLETLRNDLRENDFA